MCHKSGSPVHYRGGSLGWATRCVVLCGAMHHRMGLAVSRVVAEAVAGVQPSSNKEKAELPRMGGRRALSAPNSHSTALSSHYHHCCICWTFSQNIKKKEEGWGSTFLTFAIAHTHTLLLLRKNWINIKRCLEEILTQCCAFDEAFTMSFTGQSRDGMIWGEKVRFESISRQNNNSL